MGTKSKTSSNRKRGRGVFCLEGDWWGITDTTSIEPALELLKSSGQRAFDYIHRDVGVVAELEYYLAKWTQRQLARYPILYLGFHGDEGCVCVGDARRREHKLSLDWFEERLEGRCNKRVIHFGSCGFMAKDARRLRRFLRRTGALAVCGYKGDVGWLESIAFELLLLDEFQECAWDAGRGMAGVNRRLRKHAAGLARMLNFRMVHG